MVRGTRTDQGRDRFGGPFPGAGPEREPRHAAGRVPYAGRLSARSVWQ